KAAKNKRENKIKSKKFHRIQRKERLKKEFKEFEELQKTNPEEALKKLKEIEKARAEERVTLRHKSTGKWARNKQIRAKYDKESRQALAQQLQLSRELTQKVKSAADTDSDEEQETVEHDIQINSETNENNPWTNGKITVSQEVGDFISGYRKFWNEQNKHENESRDNKEENRELKGMIKGNANKIDPIDSKNTNENGKKLDTKVKKCFNENNVNNYKETETENNDNEANNCVVKQVAKKSNNKLIKDSEKVVNKKENKKTKDGKLNFALKKLNNRKISRGSCKKLEKSLSTSDWEVSAMDTDTLINNLPYIIQAKLEKSLEQKAKKLKRQLGLVDKKNTKNIKKKSNTKVKNPKATKDLLALPMKLKYPKLNEKMIEDTSRKSNQDILQGIDNIPENSIDAILSLDTKKSSELPKNNLNQKDIDPNKFMNAKPSILNTGIPDLLGYDDNVEKENQESAIAEAFQDDKIIDDFAEEKKAETEKEKPKDINLTLPGWGSWGGVGIKVSTRKRKRFISKFPKNIPRKDHKKGNLIIKDNKKSIKPHLVSELPFPFKSVKDFEASIRAPVGNTFIPETAFRKNILPAVMTKMGTIIEPIDNEILLKKKKK
ncbi:U3 small nucleolar RNA-associated protein 14 homolog B-like, partial [Agrilus planipennis]|uniref:U3 small nucleolar RNA-associated protein 14 homolog B-like n=1 Tax=Agrilus planipennis TaxID=224129 RepID=A0A7F5RKB5_AGRPL